MVSVDNDQRAASSILIALPFSVFPRMVFLPMEATFLSVGKFVVDA
jgi:hypothetical protein